MKKDFSGTLTTLLIGQQVNSLLTERVPSVEAQFDGLQGEKHSGITRLSDSRTPFYERGTLIRMTARSPSYRRKNWRRWPPRLGWSGFCRSGWALTWSFAAFPT
jgi:hypothetical protein